MKVYVGSLLHTFNILKLGHPVLSTPVHSIICAIYLRFVFYFVFAHWPFIHLAWLFMLPCEFTVWFVSSIKLWSSWGMYSTSWTSQLPKHNSLQSMLFRHLIKMHRYPVPQRAECYMYEHCIRSTFRSFCGDPFCKVLGFAVRKLNRSQITPAFKKLTKRFFYTTILQFRTSGLRSPTEGV